MAPGYVRNLFFPNSPNSMKSSAQSSAATMTSSVSPTLCHILAGAGGGGGGGGLSAPRRADTEVSRPAAVLAALAHTAAHR